MDKVYSGNYKVQQELELKLSAKGESKYHNYNATEKTITLKTPGGQSVELDLSNGTLKNISSGQSSFGEVNYSNGKVSYSKSVSQVIYDKGVKVEGELKVKETFGLKLVWKFPDPLPYYKATLPEADGEGYIPLVNLSYALTADLSKAIAIDKVKINLELNLNQEISIKKSKLPNRNLQTVLEYTEQGVHLLAAGKAFKGLQKIINSARIPIS